MSAGGVLATMNFPSFPSFSGRLFMGADDKDLALAMVQAYNDWHIDAWCGSHPGRFIPMALPVLWDPELCGAEIRRVAAEGLPLDHVHGEPGDARAAQLPRRVLGSDVARARRGGNDPQHPPRFVGPARGHRARRADRRDDHAAADEHLRGGRRPRVVARLPRVPGPQGRAVRGRHGLDPVLPRPARPHLRHAPPLDRPGVRDDRTPSDVFREHILTCFIADPIGIALRHEIGIDNICWEQDYPHSDSSWPNAPEEFARVAARYDVPDAEVDKITHENAMRWYRFDPFAHRPQGAVHRRRAARRGRRATTSSIRSMDKGRFATAGAPSARRARGEGDRVDGGTEPTRAPAPTAPAAEPRPDPRRGRGGVRAQGLPRRDREGDRGRGRVLGRRRLQLLRGQGRPLRPDLPAARLGVHGGHARGARRARAHRATRCIASPSSRSASSASTRTSAGSTCARRA